MARKTSIFDMNERYMDHRAPNYRLEYLIHESITDDVELRMITGHECKSTKKALQKLCPVTFAGKPFPKAPQERFEYLQFLHYIIGKNRACPKNAPSLFGCIETPSEWYLNLYNEMINEIRGKVSMNAHKLTGGVDSDITESPQHIKGKYDESIHALQQYAGRIAGMAYNLHRTDIGNGMMLFPENFDCSFNKEMNRLLEQAPTNVSFESWWDELFLRLHFARCIYWESDMLSAYQEVQEASSKPFSKDDKYFDMRKENGRAVVLDDDCMLIFDSETKRIKETFLPELGNEDTFTVSNTKLYVEELIQYIKDHVSEISEKTFRNPEPGKSGEKKILNHIDDVCEYLRMEHQRYGRNSPLSKGKLISAYQAVFLASPNLGIAPTMKRAVKAKTSKGFKRAKNTVSSVYSESDTKDPLSLQLVCAWTEYQFVWNTFGSLAAKKYLEINIRILQTILGIGYKAGMVELQRHAEMVLLATMDTLIPCKDGIVDFYDYCATFDLERRIEIDFSHLENSCSFRKFCKLFGPDKITALIVRSLDAKKQDSIYEIVLNEATDDAIRICSPTLRIRYDMAEDIYTIQNFYVAYPVTRDAPQP